MAPHLFLSSTFLSCGSGLEGLFPSFLRSQLACLCCSPCSKPTASLCSQPFLTPPTRPDFVFAC